MSYFAIYPPFLKRYDLKVAVVFNFDAFRFEGWLAARNRKIQRQYWDLFKDSQLGEYRVVEPAAGIDSIIECDLATDFDIDDPDALILKIENATTDFIENVEKLLSVTLTGAA